MGSRVVKLYTPCSQPLISSACARRGWRRSEGCPFCRLLRLLNCCRNETIKGDGRHYGLLAPIRRRTRRGHGWVRLASSWRPVARHRVSAVQCQFRTIKGRSGWPCRVPGSNPQLASPRLKPTPAFVRAVSRVACRGTDPFRLRRFRIMHVLEIIPHCSNKAVFGHKGYVVPASRQFRFRLRARRQYN